MAAEPPAAFGLIPGGMWETNTSNVNLRSGPGTGYSSQGQLKKGTDFTFTAPTGPVSVFSVATDRVTPVRSR